MKLKHSNQQFIYLFFTYFFYREIYQYLDEVDFNCDRTINNVKQQTIPDDFQAEICIDFNVENDTVGDVPK